MATVEAAVGAWLLATERSLKLCTERVALVNRLRAAIVTAEETRHSLEAALQTVEQWWRSESDKGTGIEEDRLVEVLEQFLEIGLLELGNWTHDQAAAEPQQILAESFRTRFLATSEASNKTDEAIKETASDASTLSSKIQRIYDAYVKSFSKLRIECGRSKIVFSTTTAESEAVQIGVTQLTNAEQAFFLSLVKKYPTTGNRGGGSVVAISAIEQTSTEERDQQQTVGHLLSIRAELRLHPLRSALAFLSTLALLQPSRGREGRAPLTGTNHSAAALLKDSLSNADRSCLQRLGISSLILRDALQVRWISLLRLVNQTLAKIAALALPVASAAITARARPVATAANTVPSNVTQVEVREYAEEALEALHREAILLAQLVRLGLMSLDAAWTLFANGTFPHVDCSDKALDRLRSLTHEENEYASKATTETIVSDTSIRGGGGMRFGGGYRSNGIGSRPAPATTSVASASKHTEILGNNYCLVKYHTTRPNHANVFPSDWHAKSSPVAVPKLGAPTFLQCLIIAKAYSQAATFIRNGLRGALIKPSTVVVDADAIEPQTSNIQAPQANTQPAPPPSSHINFLLLRRECSRFGAPVQLIADSIVEAFNLNLLHKTAGVQQDEGDNRESESTSKNVQVGEKRTRSGEKIGSSSETVTASANAVSPASLEGAQKKEEDRAARRFLSAAAQLWDDLWPLIDCAGPYLCDCVTLNRLCLVLRAGVRGCQALHDDIALNESWLPRLELFLRRVFFPALATAMPTDLFPSIALCDLLKTLPRPDQRRIALGISNDTTRLLLNPLAKDLSCEAQQADPLARSSSLFPHERIALLKHRALLNYCLSRMTSVDADEYSRVLEPTMRAMPLLVLERLTANAIGYPDIALQSARALLLRNGSPLLRFFFPIVVLDRARHAAEKQDKAAEQRVTALATLVSIVWRQSWDSLDAGQILDPVIKSLGHARSRSSYLFSIQFLKAVFSHLIHRLPDSEVQFTLSNLKALSCDNVSRWYAAGEGSTFEQRWVAGFFSPKLVEDMKKNLSQVLVSSSRGDDFGVTLLLLLLQAHAQLHELYSDLPGAFEEIQATTGADYDALTDLTLALRLSITVTKKDSTDHSIMKLCDLNVLSKIACRSMALVLCSQRKQVSSSLIDLVPAQKSSSAAPSVDPSLKGRGITTRGTLSAGNRVVLQKPKPSAPTTGNQPTPKESPSVAPSPPMMQERVAGILTNAYGPSAAHLWAMTCTNGNGTQQDKQAMSQFYLYAMFWALELKHVRYDVSAYEAAEAQLRHFNQKADTNLKEGLNGLRSKESELDFKGTERDILKEKSENKSKFDRLRGVTMKGVLPLLFPPVVPEDVTSDTSSSEVAALFVHYCLLPRVILSHRDAVFGGSFLRYIIDATRDGTLLCGVPLARVKRWALSVAVEFVTAVFAQFASFTYGECRRVIVALQDILPLIHALSNSNERGSTGIAKILSSARCCDAGRQLRLQLDAFLAQSFCALLWHEPTTYCAIHRNALIMLDPLKAFFPLTRSAARVLLFAIRRHAIKESPNYANASRLASLLKDRKDKGTSGLGANDDELVAKLLSEELEFLQEELASRRANQAQTAEESLNGRTAPQGDDEEGIPVEEEAVEDEEATPPSEHDNNGDATTSPQREEEEDQGRGENDDGLNTEIHHQNDNDDDEVPLNEDGGNGVVVGDDTVEAASANGDKDENEEPDLKRRRLEGNEE